MSKDLNYKAGRLLTLAMKDKKGRMRDQQLRSLLNETRQNPEFQKVVNELAEGMGIQLLHDQTLGQLIVLPIDSDSVFSPSLSDMKTGGGEMDNNKYIIAVMGVVACYFPTSDSLDNPLIGEEGRTLDAVTQDFSSFCNRLLEECSDSTGQYRRVLDEICNLPIVTPAKATKNLSIEKIMNSILKHFVEVGYLHIREVENVTHYMVEPRFAYQLSHFGLIRENDIVMRIKADLEPAVASTQVSVESSEANSDVTNSEVEA